ncbi:MAG: dihydroorotate dehydrogenase electron transfer subunit [Lachnospiraceae bacterium]|nr:dihydroorotate dehydrogenase electron transfer subunit [Lachnospiraceae bacterium]
MKFKENSKIVKADKLAEGVYSIWFETENIAKESKAGQFISVYCNEGSRILPRPISICEVEGNKLRIVYRVVGKGTEEFSRMNEGESLDIMGPLGNGYTLKDNKALLIAGGIGIPPMVQCAKELKNMGVSDITIVAGYRNNDIFLKEELEKYGKLYIATEDGSVGTKGNVMNAIKENGITADVIYTCGPTPMLKAIKEWALAEGIEAQLSLEEKMACGIGACLACVCQSKEIDHHSQVHNKRICKDGPVFLAQEVEL